MGTLIQCMCVVVSKQRSMETNREYCRALFFLLSLRLSQYRHRKIRLCSQGRFAWFTQFTVFTGFTKFTGFRRFAGFASFTGCTLGVANKFLLNFGHTWHIISKGDGQHFSKLGCHRNDHVTLQLKKQPLLLCELMGSI